jgi:acyl dehydratase
VKSYYFEDFGAGDAFDCGTRLVSREDILRFAHEFDPQPYHTDEVFAAKSKFGGLIASGLHSTCICLRLANDTLLSKTKNLGSPGWNDIKFLGPLRPGDTVRLKLQVVDTVPSQSRPDRGRVHFLFELFNQAEEKILEAHAVTIAQRRTAAEE